MIGRSKLEPCIVVDVLYSFKRYAVEGLVGLGDGVLVLCRQTRRLWRLS